MHRRLVAILVCFPLAAMPVLFADNPDWTVKPEDATEPLDDTFELPGFEFNPPQDFRSKELKGVKEHTYFWHGPVREDETYAHLMVILVTLPEHQSKLGLQEMLNQTTAPIKARRDDWQQTKPELGEVNGLSFIRTRWSGIVKDFAREGLAGREMHGFVYMARHGRTAIQILCHDVSPGHAETLKAGEAAALTFRPILADKNHK